MHRLKFQQDTGRSFSLKMFRSALIFFLSLSQKSQGGLHAPHSLWLNFVILPFSSSSWWSVWCGTLIGLHPFKPHLCSWGWIILPNLQGLRLRKMGSKKFWWYCFCPGESGWMLCGKRDKWNNAGAIQGSAIHLLYLTLKTTPSYFALWCWGGDPANSIPQAPLLARFLLNFTNGRH